MIQLVIGLVLIFIVFLLVILFKNKKDGFFYVLSGLIGFSTFLFIILLGFHIFYYWVILLIYLLIDIFIIFYIYRKIGFKEISSNLTLQSGISNRHSRTKCDTINGNVYNGIKTSLSNVKIDWMLIFILIILFIELGSVHFNYSGKMTFSNGIREVDGARAIYPYYSDEWSAVSLIKYSIENNALPLVNPLFENFPFSNPEFVFHSFLSGLMLFFGLNVLTYYSFFALFFSIVICILVYFLLRYNNVSRLNAGIACLFLPFIVNGANLPGLWYLIPLTLGIICMLLGYIFISMNRKKLCLIMSILVLAFYPPLFVFYTLSILLFIYFSDTSKKDKVKYFLVYFGICLLVAILISIGLLIQGNFSFSNVFNYIFSKIFYSTFTDNAIPDYSIWKIIPIPILLLGLLGIFIKLKDKTIYWLVAPIVIGFIYWTIYSLVLWRFIIEYQRVVFTTSLLVVCFSGFGLEFLYGKLRNLKYFKEYNLFLYLQIGLLILLLIFSFSYTQNELWNELKLKGINNNEELSPNPPASSYLIDEDLILFSNISHSRFLSTSWKGLVIGAATGNYPLDSKSSTITVNFLTYDKFMNSNCSAKQDLAKAYGIDYVYLDSFDCEYFRFVAKSDEGFYLYRFIKD